MKKVVAILAVVFLAACNQSGTGTTNVDSTKVDTVKVDSAVNADTTVDVVKDMPSK